MLKLSSILLFIFTSFNSGIYAKNGDVLINQTAPQWGKLQWINSAPLELKKLEGKVVLIRWWTDTCSFCEHTADALNELHDIFEAKGLIVIGMYHPKPPGTLRREHVLKATKRLGFKFPIGLDTDWNALRQYWLVPAKPRWTSPSFLISKTGKIRYIHPGGEYHAGRGEAHTECHEAFRKLKEQIKSCLSEAVRNSTGNK